VKISTRPKRVSHPNLIVEDYDASMAHFRKLFGAELILDLPSPNWHACLIEIGGVIIELFAPPAFLLHTRHGPHFLGIEYEADMGEVREAVASHGIRIMRDLGVALHTDPADGFGIDFEFYGGSFIDNEPPHLTQLLKPIEYWRHEHPLGLDGLKSYTAGVSGIDEAIEFFESFVSAELVYDELRPEIGARAVGLRVADCVAELLTPTGNGMFQRELQRNGEGMRSIVFRVEDASKAKAHFVNLGVNLIPGTAPGSFAIDPSDNRGILFEFAE
jgi:catechol 2,3-dioxygenase-like lactoylglutathione lyase family enzyme